MLLAVDIGGTKTLLAVFDENGQITEERKFPTPQDYEEFKRHLAEEVAKFTTSTFSRGVVAVPGRVDRQKGVGLAFGNLPWQNVPIQSDCQQILGCPVQIENDANLAGLSEATLIKDRYVKAVYLTISTGIGGVFVVEGIIDPNTIDAEVGHMLLAADGEVTDWEDMASGKWIVNTYGQRADEINDPKIWEKISHNLAIGIINTSAAYTPDVIILGGGVGAHLDKFQQHLSKQIQNLTPALVTVPPIVEAQRPEEAVIYGCFELAKASHS